jgi:hypothetical protein
MLALIGVTSALAQDIRFDNPPSTVSVTPVAVYGLGRNNNDWRAGLALPVLNFRDGRRAGYPTFATGNIWILTDAKALRRTYFGAGLDVTLVERKNMRLGLTAGWSADFSNLEHVRDGRWGVGPTLTIRF